MFVLKCLLVVGKDRLNDVSEMRIVWVDVADCLVVVANVKSTRPEVFVKLLQSNMHLFTIPISTLVEVVCFLNFGCLLFLW